jgi:hypothetical protein
MQFENSACQYPLGTDLEEAISWLKRVHGEKPYYLINYRTLVFQSAYKNMSSIFGEDASLYYVQTGPHMALEYPHLYGFVTLAHTHGLLTRQCQFIQISYHA